jgi:hypothetical protein
MGKVRRSTQPEGLGNQAVRLVLTLLSTYSLLLVSW